MNDPIIRTDIAIVGAGMAGASLAAALAGSVRVVMLEAEDIAGYHSTGRSAAFWSETYGGPAVQPLTSASFAFLDGAGFLGARGAVHLAASGDAGHLDRLEAEFEGRVRLDRLDRSALEQLIPGLRLGYGEGLAEPSCRDIDVARLHAHYLAEARRAGADMRTRARLLSADRVPGGWLLGTTAGQVRADLLVNAAGAWADEVAAMAGQRPLGIAPLRRTMVQLAVEPATRPDMPLVMDAAGLCYFKPEVGGRLWLSPHDETPVDPCDVAPEEIDVARAIDRLERVVDWTVARKERAWAGLRSFAPDRVPVYGAADAESSFFWFAGQGGFGIQTAPAAAAIGAAMLLGRALPESLGAIDPSRYRPGRFDGR
ncbi:NAD(P)/FAD-dependent oxidoreductase [Rhizorhabdus phycosphaerae]|uniref:NAD(P)/FAD-dependent oxidoreductase n=1 Tax=Rhizorhabdus phycosphaerae TaxID=2711156 RepID=UPI0013EC74DB|nr:FAD-dependent oxidoreductase [Rhizorhabdus phycosphaerae]